MTKERSLPSNQFRTTAKVTNPTTNAGFDPTKYELIEDPKPDPKKSTPLRHKIGSLFLNKYSAILLILALHANPTDLGTTLDVRTPNPFSAGSIRFNVKAGDLETLDKQVDTDPGKDYKGFTLHSAFFRSGFKLNLDSSENKLRGPIEVRLGSAGLGQHPVRWGFTSIELSDGSTK